MTGGRFGPGTPSWMLKHPRGLAIQKVAAILQQRDRNICIDLYEHKVLTTFHILDMYFENHRICNRRLLDLYQLGVVQRFRPNVERGSAPYHFVLGDIGAHVVAAERGVRLRDLNYNKNTLAILAYSPRLTHLIAVNTFFARLISACRQNDDCHVETWLSENQSRAKWGRIVLPDALGRIAEPARGQTFFLEMDRGTERPWRLAKKLEGYHDASLVAEAPQVLLFCFPDERREVSGRKALRHCGLLVATASLGPHCQDPLGPIWLPLGSTRRRSILDLHPRDARPLAAEAS